MLGYDCKIASLFKIGLRKTEVQEHSDALTEFKACGIVTIVNLLIDEIYNCLKRE
jgi:hypothetical protein